MKLRNVHLALGNIARTTNSKSLEAIGIKTLRKRNPDGTWSDDLIGYAIDCAVRKGDTQTVKFPLSVADKIAELQNYLNDNVLVNITFIGLKLSLYEMKSSNGEMLAGVSAKADDFEMEVIHPDIDDIPIDLD